MAGTNYSGLRFFRNQSLIAAFDVSETGLTPAGSTIVTPGVRIGFDRVSLSWTPQGDRDPILALCDGLTEEVAGTPEGSYFVADYDLGELRLSVWLRMRALVHAAAQSRISLEIVLETDAGHLKVKCDDAVEFSSIELHRISAADLETHFATLSAPDSATPLLDRLGMSVGPMHQRSIKLRLGKPTTGLPARSNLFVPIIERAVTLRRGLQALQLNELAFHWTESEIVAAHLHHPPPSPDLIPPDEIYNEQQSRFVVRQELAFTEPGECIDPTLPTGGAWWVTMGGWPTNGILAGWNRDVVAAHYKALKEVVDGQPISGLPWLARKDSSDQDPLWEFRLQVIDRAAALRALQPADFLISSVPETGKLTVGLERLRPLRWDAGHVVELIATFPALIDHRGDPLSLRMNLPPGSEQWPAGIYFRLRHVYDDSGETLSQTLRAGALDLAFDGVALRRGTPKSGDVLSETVFSTIQINLRSVRAGRPQDDEPTPWVDVPTLNVDMHLGLRAILPGGQDIPIEEKFVGAESNINSAMETDTSEVAARFLREESLVVYDTQSWEHPTQRSKNAQHAAFVLRINERTLPNRSQTLSMNLLINSAVSTGFGAGSAGQSSVYVIDRHPFFVGHVSTPVLTASASTDGLREIANWTGSERTGASWELRDLDSGVDLRIPPQAVGEELEKFKNGSAPARLHDLADNKYADFRFSPPAQLHFEPLFAGRFVDAPWNLRRLVGFHGQAGLEYSLETIDFELLYGLACRLGVPGTRVSEVGRLLGNLAGSLATDLPWRQVAQETVGTAAQHAIFQDVRERWSHTYARLLSRLSVVVPWFGDPRVDFALREKPCRQLRFTLRNSADLRFPTNDNLVEANKAPFRATGLAGGATWGITVGANAASLQRSPSSTSSELSRPIFSALGGWGLLKAGFNGDNVKISADVSMGRTTRYVVSELGRIGVFWNRAKRVSVYERTVVPTPSQGRGQDPLVGRPVVRLVESYIEILVPKIQYGSAAAGVDEKLSRGCVLGIEFKSRIIPIPGGTGSTIPLWKRCGDQTLFPRPQVVLELAGDPAIGRNKSVFAEIDEAEKLMFYSSGESTPPEEWDPVPGVDFLEEPDPQPPDELPYDEADMDAPLTEVPVPDGPLTFGLFPVSEKVNLAADRALKAVGSRLKNVYVARSRSVAAHPRFAALAKLRRDGSRAAFSPLLAALPKAGAQISVASANDLVRRAAAKVSAALDDLAAQASFIAPSGLKGPLADLSRNFDETVAAWQDRANSTPPALTSLSKQAASIEAGLGAARWLPHSLHRVETELAAWGKQASEFLAVLHADSGDRDSYARIVARRNALMNYTQTTLDSLSMSSQGRLGRGFEEARLALRAQSFRLRSLPEAWSAATSRQRVSSLHSQLERFVTRDLPALVAPLVAAREDLKKLIDGLRHDVQEVAMIAMSPTDPSDSDDRKRVVASLASAVDTQVRRLQSWLGRRETGALLADDIGDFAHEIKVIKKQFETAMSDVAVRATSIEVLRQQVRHQVEGLRTHIDERINVFYEQAYRQLKAALTDASTGQVGDPAFRLLRAYGEAPSVPMLEFNRDQLAYYFDPHQLPIATSPVTALVDRAENEALKAVGIRQPTRAVLEQLLPYDNLEDFALAELFPDFAGMKLDGLLQAVAVPDDLKDNIHIQHGFDRQTQSAWLKMQVDFRIPEPSQIFTFGPITVTLVTATFHAKSETSTDLSGAVRRKVEGVVRGDWLMEVAGYKVVTFVETDLTFDETGKLRYRIEPHKIRMHAALQFLADLLSTFMGDTEGGVTFRIRQEGSLPVGVEALLNLPLPDLQFGAFGVSNLRLSAGFELVAVPNFAIGVRFAIGRKMAPFTITIFILGGAGSLEIAAYYIVPTKRIQAKLSAAIAVSAMLAIAFGPLKGSVAIYAGLGVEFERNFGEDAPAGELTIIIFILLRGEVSLWFASVSLAVLLAAAYNGATGNLIGRGHVEFTIKVGFFKKSFSRDIEVTLAGSSSRLGKRRTVGLDAYDHAAQRYIQILA